MTVLQHITPMLALLLITACETGAAAVDPPPAEAAAPAQAWTYTFRLDADFAALDTELCFDGKPPALLAPIDGSAHAYLTDAGGWPVTEAGIDLSEAEADACVRFRVDLDAARAEGDHNIRRIGPSLVAAPYIWLWAPETRPEGARVSARFELPEGFREAVPWPHAEAPGVYRVPDSIYHLKGNAAWGPIERETLDIGGAALDVVHLEPGAFTAVGDAAIRAWLRDSAEAVSGLFDGFPVPRAQLLLVPVPGAEVVFGTATRGGGPTIMLMTGRRVDAEALARDWIAVHEMVHLGIPFLSRRAPWLYEGLPTYYGAVLRARQGMMSVDDAWEELEDGFRRGNLVKPGRTLREESAVMHQARTYWRVYWSGALIALLADVAIRAESDGARSLDDAMRELHACCLDPERVWDAETLLEQLGDDPDSNPLLRITRRHLDSSEFPSRASLYTDTGLSFGVFGHVRYLDAEHAEHRDAIMAPQ